MNLGGLGNLCNLAADPVDTSATGEANSAFKAATDGITAYFKTKALLANPSAAAKKAADDAALEQARAQAEVAKAGSASTMTYLGIAGISIAVIAIGAFAISKGGSKRGRR